MSSFFLLFLSCSGAYKESKDSGEANKPPEGDPATVELAGSCSLDQRLGGFSVAVNQLYSAVGGAVANGVLPAAVLTEVQREGGCVLWRRENPFCDPACDAGEACDVDGSCIPYPENQDLGRVRVAGLNEAVFMEAVQPGNSYYAPELPQPVVDPDRLVELTTEGGAFSALTLHGVGAEPLVLEPAEWVIGAGALGLNWGAPSGLGRSEIFLRLTVDQHGLTPLSLECVLPDSGSTEIPASMIDPLLQAGVSGYPNALVSRRTMDRVALEEGCVDFSVSFDVAPDVTVEGHVPCDSHDDCPFGTRCNFALETCE